MSISDLEGRVVLASIKETIDAPANEIWPFLSAIGAERILIPGCTRSSILQGYGEGSVRRVYFGDVFFDEKILECDSKTYKLKYEVVEPNPSPATGVLAVAQLHPLESEGSTVITWISGAKIVPPEHKSTLEEQALGFCKGQVESLRRLSRATTTTM
ncbi:polyketide cyclase dehydrase protein [Fusarium avenaceum]|nr:polyketide cyclase dehydrase protein [Fusarium avenaceum]